VPTQHGGEHDGCAQGLCQQPRNADALRRAPRRRPVRRFTRRRRSVTAVIPVRRSLRRCRRVLAFTPQLRSLLRRRVVTVVPLRRSTRRPLLLGPGNDCSSPHMMPLNKINVFRVQNVLKRHFEQFQPRPCLL
jgi:hypothetical protein